MRVKLRSGGGFKRGWLVAAFAAALVLAGGSNLHADQVEMQNGDRYVGRVVLLTGDTLVIQSDVLGRVQLPRGKVALITFGAATLGKPAPAAAATANPTNVQYHLPTPSARTNAELATAFRQIGANTNLVQQVQKQFLSEAGPEATQKFNELLAGVMNGNVTMSDLRAQAKSAADQVRALRKDGGEEAGPALDGYLEILDKFLQETSSGEEATNLSGLH